MVDRTYAQQDKHRQLDDSKKGKIYFRNAVERHWDPYEIDLSKDRDRILEMVEEFGEESLDRMLTTIASFTVGEEAVTEDLLPISRTVADVEDELFLTTQMYEEAKHAEFFDRYWTEVIWAAEDELGRERSSVFDEENYADNYWAMFEKLESDTDRVLDDPTPENLATAICTYHLSLEGIGAQSGYYSMHMEFGDGDEVPELPHLPGLVEGFSQIRQDEGRHVGWGMYKLKSMIREGKIESDLVRETVDYIVEALVESNSARIDAQEQYADLPQLSNEAFTEYVLQKHEERMQQIVNASADIPDIDSLTNIRRPADD